MGDTIHATVFEGELLVLDWPEPVELLLVFGEPALRGKEIVPQRPSAPVPVLVVDEMRGGEDLADLVLGYVCDERRLVEHELEMGGDDGCVEEVENIATPQIASNEAARPPDSVRTKQNP